MSEDGDFPTIAPGSILLGRYRAESMLGVGGMGLVVAATHLSLGNRVAIKFLLPKFATSTEAAHRFVREAKAASKIGSEHVARVHDTGTSPEHGPYIVMEYLEGGDLSRHLKGPYVFAVAEAIDYVVQACEALAHAHAAGIVHRDVKPANLFLGTRPDGMPIVKVLDFGISKVAEDSNDMGMTKTTAILGSGFYMSPEQMRSSKNVDLRTDIYGLGITLYELLTKTVPFHAESFADLAIKVAVDPPDPIARHRSDVSPELEAAIGKAYAKKPADRYQSVGEMCAALAPWAAVETQPVIESVLRICGASPGRLPSLRPVQASLPPASALPPPARLPSIPPPYLGGPMSIPPPPALPAGMVPLHGSGSAPALAMTTTGGSSKTLIGAAVALAVVIGVGVGAGLYVRDQGLRGQELRGQELRGQEQRGAASGPPITTASAASAPPSSPPSSSTEPIAEVAPPPPEPAASASAAPSANGPDAGAPAALLPIRPRPVRSAAPSAAPSAATPPPPRLCEVHNPEKGLRELLPCK